MNLTDKSTANKENKETTVPKQIGWMFACVAFFIISCIVGWLVYKKKFLKN